MWHACEVDMAILERRKRVGRAFSEALLTARSLLFPMSMMLMFGFACCRASSSHDARWLNVSLLKRGEG